MAADELPMIDHHQRLWNHYQLYLNFLAILFALVIQQNLSAAAMNQLRVAMMVFTINFATSLGIQPTSNAPISCSKSHRRFCILRIIFYVTMLVTPGILIFIYVVWQPMLEYFGTNQNPILECFGAIRNPILEYFGIIWIQIKNLVFGDTAMPPPEVEDSIFRKIYVVVYSFLGWPTEPVLPVSIPPATTTRWRWSSLISFGFLGWPTEPVLPAAIPPATATGWRWGSLNSYGFLGSPTEPVLPAAIPPATATGWRWGSLISDGRRRFKRCRRGGTRPL